jgi:integrase
VSFLTPDQARLVRELSAGLPVHPLLSAALGTGCRQGELLALGWGDINIQAGSLRVRQSLSMTRDGFVVKEPKTPAARRTITRSPLITLPPFTVEALTDLKAARLRAGLLTAPVFCTRTGNYLNKDNVLRAYRAVVGKVNEVIAKDEGAKPIAPTVRFHDLRHLVASILVTSNHSLRAASQRLGHSNPALTPRVYAHCLPLDDSRLADGLARLLG